MIVKTSAGTQPRSSSIFPEATFARISVDDKSIGGIASGTTRATPRSAAGTGGSAAASRHMTANFTLRQSRSASRHLSSNANWSAPKIQKKSARGNASSKCSTVRTDQLVPPCSSSQDEISARGNGASAARSIASLSAPEAPGARVFSGDCAAGTKISRSSFSSKKAASARDKCARCGGSKLPPKIPTRIRRNSGSPGAGTGSFPPRENGLHRSTRHAASSVPVKNPCFSSACRAYSEHVGEKRQKPFPPERSRSAGETIFR